MGKTIGVCPDCGTKDIELMSNGIYEGLCNKCRMRKQNAKHRKIPYIPYINLSEDQKKRISAMQAAQAAKKKEEIIIPEVPKTIPIIENYYQVKAENNPAIAQITEKPIIKKAVDPLSDQFSFITILKNNGCEIPDDNLKEALDVLVKIDKLKDLFIRSTEINNQTILNLEEVLNIVEKKLQHNWEYNGFQEIDDITFKGFLTWRRVLKEAIFFWKQLYQVDIANILEKEEK